MKQIEGLTNEASQLHHILLEDKTTAEITIAFLPSIQRWQIDISHERLTASGMLITNNPNFIRQYRHTAEFGLACIAVDGVDPFQIDDFSTGRVGLYLLEGTDLNYVEDTIIGQQ